MHLLSALIDEIPDTSARRIDIAVTVVHSSAGAVPDALRTLHMTDISRLLKETISAHTASKERPFDKPLVKSQQTISG
jgi:F420-dependent methylenetetrahydromethanopterin dehydrogenase